MSSKTYCNLLPFSVIFHPSAYANGHLRPKVWYENDRKNMETLIVYKWKKCWFSTNKFSKLPIRIPCLIITVMEVQSVLYDNLRTFRGMKDFWLKYRLKIQKKEQLDQRQIIVKWTDVLIQSCRLNKLWLQKNFLI